MDRLRRTCVIACFLLVVGCPGDDTNDDTAASDSHDNDHDHGGEEHGMASEGGEEHGATEDHDHSIDTNADDPAVMLCSCLLANCHEPYHAKYGEDEMVAESACLMEADGLPMNGEDIDMGNFIECRVHFCEMAESDDSVCPNALGEAVCM